jgi:hypothetical protein
MKFIKTTFLIRVKIRLGLSKLISFVSVNARQKWFKLTVGPQLFYKSFAQANNEEESITYETIEL